MDKVLDSLAPTDKPARQSFVSLATLRLLCAYYFFLRRVHERVRPGLKRMRASRREFYSAIWRRAVESSGASLRVLSDGVSIIERGDTSIQVCDNVTSLDPAIAVARAEDKPTVRSLLARSGVAIPKGIVIEFADLEKAWSMLRSSSQPLVVKPAESTSGGAGVTTNVTNVRQLRIAFAWARSFCPRVLVEEQVEGDCYRVLVMDGEVLDTVVRKPPRIVGDGASTVSQLIHRENSSRLKAGASRAQVLIGFDADLRNTLARQGLTLRSRPANGQTVMLKGVINDNGGSDNVPSNGLLCAAILESALSAAKVVGARLAGIDIICRDPAIPLEVSGGAVIEVNTAPGLYYHYHRTDSSVPIADRVLRRVFDLATD